MSELHDSSLNTNLIETPKINSTFNASSRIGIKALLSSSKELLNNSLNEENPTHFLQLNNSSYDADVKLIKVKIIVPKGTLNNSKFDHKSNVLTVMNDIDKITFNVCAPSEHSSEVLKITNILNKEEQVSISKPKSNYPIMGTNALLVKTTSDAAKKTPNLSDSAIIRELVNERYQDSMIELYERNYKRQTSRRSSLQTTSRTTSENSVVDNITDTNYNFVADNIKHSSTMLNDLEENIKYFDSSETAILERCSVEDTFNQSEDVKIEQPEAKLQNTIIQNANQSFNSSDFNVDVTLGSAIDFILSTNLDPSSTSKESNQLSTPLNSRSDFDEDKFLQRALGEELNGYQSHDSCAEIINETSLVSSKSINSSDVSFLLSRASSLYSTVSNKIRHLQRRLPLHSSGDTISEEEDSKEAMETSSSSTGEERLARLIHDSVVQHQIMMQTGKALGYCRSVKEFTGSREVVEGERMLLLATCKCQAIQDVIRKFEDGDHNNEDGQNSQGTITITNLNFHPQEITPAIPKKSGQHKHTQTNQWFVCIVNCNEFTYATEAKMADKDGFVRFGEEALFRFDNLAIDFDLKVELHAINMKSALRSYSHESKYHLKKNVKSNSSILCPPAPRTSLLQQLTQSRFASAASPLNAPNPMKHSFLPFGTFTLRLSNINAKYYRLTKMPTVASCQLSAVFSMAVETGLMVRAKGAGFMTLGQGSTVTAWSRHWCELDGSEVSWWNYPPQDGVQRTNAIGSVDLRACISARITSVDRNVCARPRTLLLETATSDNEGKTTRYLLSCDNAHDLSDWEGRLNAVLGILRSWNAMDGTNNSYFSKRNLF